MSTVLFLAALRLRDYQLGHVDGLSQGSLTNIVNEPFSTGLNIHAPVFIRAMPLTREAVLGLFATLYLCPAFVIITSSRQIWTWSLFSLTDDH